MPTAIGLEIFPGVCMSSMIETMESRLLFSAAPSVIAADLVTAKTAAITAKTDLTAALSVITTEAKALKKDAASTHLDKLQKSLLNSLEKTVSGDETKYKKQISSILSTGLTDGARLEAQLSSLEKHPTSTKVQAKVSVALAKLEGVFSETVISTLESKASAAVGTVNSALFDLAIAVPSTTADVSSTEKALSADLLTLSTDATTLQDSIAQLATDLS